MRRWFNSWWFKVASTLVLVTFLFAWVGPKKIWASAQTSDLRLLAISMLFTPAVIGIKTLRWLLLARTHTPISFPAALQSYLAGLTLAVLTPLAAGEAGRGLFVRTKDLAGLTGKVILDKLVDLSAVGLFSGLGLVLVGGSAALGAGIAILAGMVAAWTGMILWLPKLNERTKPSENSWLARLRVHDIARGLTDTPRAQLVINAILSLVGFTVFYSQAFVILLAYYPQAPLAAIPTFPIITLSTILPIAIGGLGIREWTAVILLRQFDIGESIAFNTFFTHFVIVQFLPALLGAVIIGYQRWATRQVDQS